ncbi:4a-hydroxytetrahydrobiopterin dehydratase [Patescibacteria group bacterium]|nr:4a-hydroxytetrahydrobiopterin dehydratase [Patescibacteria group bacterium]
MNLTQRKCVPCEGGTPPFTQEKVEEYLQEVSGWELKESKLIFKTFRFKSFKEAIDFVNQVASIAEQEQHHPDIHIRYKKVTLEFTTHAIKGLSENDFIMASKIDVMYGWQEKVEKVVIKKMFSIKFLVIVIVVLIIILFVR